MKAATGGPVDAAALRSHIRSLYRAGFALDEDGRPHPLVPQGVLEADGEALRDLAIREGARATVETGLCFGLSALSMCEALVASGQPDVRHVAMDPGQRSLAGGAGLRALREAGVAGIVEFHERKSQVVLPELLAQGRVFDLAFIDGDHRFDAAFIDLYYLHRLVKPGGLLVVDDVWMPSVRLAVSYFVTNVGLEVVPSPFPGAQFRPESSGWLRRITDPPKARLAVLRCPAELRPRPWWGHFEPFADAEAGLVRARAAIALEEQAKQWVDRARPLARRLRAR
ncbi:MAG: O-methyltransferase [Acidimicrobiales bacterium]